MSTYSPFAFYRFLASYYDTYPRIIEGSSLCSYYRKQNKMASVSYIIIFASVLLTQAMRYTTAVIWRESWEYWGNIFVMWILMDVSLIAGTLYGLQILSKSDQASNKRNLKYQVSASLNLQWFSLGVTAVFALVPFTLPRVGNISETTALMWVIFSILQLQVCVWLTKGLLYQIAFMIVFNWGYCWSAIYLGSFAFKNYTKFTTPVMLSVPFFIAFDRQLKENFLLRSALKRQKDMYEKHLEKVKDPVVILDRSELLFANAAAREKLCDTLTQFWEKACFIVSEAGRCLDEVVKGKLENPNVAADTVSQTKYYMHDPSEDTVTYKRILNVTEIESTSLSHQKVVSIAFHDVTEELVAEESRVESKYKNMLFFSLSHELRTPLSIFQAFLAVSKKTLRTPEEIEKRKDAKGAWRYLRNKISDILDYAQIIADEFVLHKTSISLRGFVKQLNKDTYRSLSSRRTTVKLSFTVEPGLRDELFCDRARLEQVLFNFLSNAVKFTSAGQISLAVYSAQDGGRTSAITFEVSDTGSGMSPEFVSTLFSLKTQPRSSLEGELVRMEHKTKSAGLSGLGLTVSRMICSHMGSTIRVHSVLGKGSSFSFTLPAEEPAKLSIEDSDTVPEERTAVNSCEHLPLFSPQTKLRPFHRHSRSEDHTESPAVVLIVDDNELIRGVVRNMVQKQGFATVEAENGLQAISQLEQLQQSEAEKRILVFMDIDMPVMDGIEATIEIRKRDKTPRPHIVALTAFASEEERHKCLAVGMNDFVSKPVTKDGLVSLFRNLKLKQ